MQRTLGMNLDLGTRLDDFLRSLQLKFSKILFETHGEIFVAAIIFLLVRPGRCWRKYIVWHAWALLRHFKPENRIPRVGHLIEAPGQSRIQQGACVPDRDTLAHTVRSTHPACVYEPTLRAVTLDLAL